MNCEIPDVQAGFRKGRGTRDQIANICWIMEKARENGLEDKASAHNVGDPSLIPGSGRSPGEGNGNPLQHPCLENPMEGGA